MAKINVIILNGKPRSGKDTVAKFIRRYCDDTEYAWYWHYSTIDPVKSALKSLGWDGEKNDHVRDMLASLKQFWINNCDGALRYCMDKVNAVINNHEDVGDHIIIFQIREPEEIKKLENALNPISRAYDLSCSTLFISRPEAEERACTNSADSDVGCYLYDRYIENNGTEDELREKIYEYVNTLLGKGGE